MATKKKSTVPTRKDLRSWLLQYGWHREGCGAYNQSVCGNCQSCCPNKKKNGHFAFKTSPKTPCAHCSCREFKPRKCTCGFAEIMDTLEQIQKEGFC